MKNTKLGSGFGKRVSGIMTGCEGSTEQTQKQTKGTERKIKCSSRNQEARRNLKLISEGTGKRPWPQME